MTTCTFLFEIYRTGPEGQRGWSIQTGWLVADGFEDARAFLSALPAFDVIVDCYEANMNDGDVATYTTPRAAQHYAERINTLRTTAVKAKTLAREYAAKELARTGEAFRSAGRILELIAREDFEDGADLIGQIVQQIENASGLSRVR